MRLIGTVAVISLLAFPAQAASPKVESATKVFQSVAADPAKVKTYCEMSKDVGVVPSRSVPGRLLPQLVYELAS